MRGLLAFFTVILTFSLKAEDLKNQYSYTRVFEKAEASINWDKLSLREKLMKVRAVAMKNKTVSDPVSDRYTITAYGGPIDLVHFLMLAAEAQKDGIDMNDRLYKEWVQEGGEYHLNGFNPKYPCEAHPDDLPSNALGALFGLELKSKGMKGSLKDAFAEFIKPLVPVPDLTAKKFSHRMIVMGLPTKIDKQTESSRYIWFTAEPLNISKLINYEHKKLTGEDLCETASSAKDCLHKAGFQLRLYKNKSIIISRL